MVPTKHFWSCDLGVPTSSPLEPRPLRYPGISSPHPSLLACGKPCGHPQTLLFPLRKHLDGASLPDTAHVSLCPATRWYKGLEHLQQKEARKEQPRAPGRPAAGWACWVLVAERQAGWPRGPEFLLLLCLFVSEGLGPWSHTGGKDMEGGRGQPPQEGWEGLAALPQRPQSAPHQRTGNRMSPHL